MMEFTSLTLQSWQQFDKIEINFEARATIITGSNGSGKTTILSMLARHRGWQPFTLATPKTGKVDKILKYFSRYRLAGKDESPDRVIGSIKYSNGAVGSIVVPETSSAQYQIQILNQNPARFFYIPSHRQTFTYRRAGMISTVIKNRSQAFEEIQGSNLQRHMGNGAEPSSFLMKNTLLGWVVNGYGVRNGEKVIMPSDASQIKNFEGFRDILRLVLPETLGFEDIEVRDYEIVFCCNGGADEFLLETASGGVSALIDIAWQIFMFDTEAETSFTVVIDEVENHLHPSMQRMLLPSLLRAFPNIKLIVSTHSPLIVTSVEGASVYVLKYNEKNKVFSTLLNFNDEVLNAVDVLDEVLGVSTTLPIWAVSKLSEILKKHESVDPTTETLKNLRDELESAGLTRLMPQAIEAIAEARK